MSIEEALVANTKAVEALTAAIIASNEGREAALAKAAELAAGGGATTTRTRKAKDTADTPPTDSSAGAAPETPKGPTVDQLRAAGAAFFEKVKDDDEKTSQRKAFVKGLIDKHGGGVNKLVDIPADKYAVVIEAFKSYQDPAPAAEADDDLMG